MGHTRNIVASSTGKLQAQGRTLPGSCQRELPTCCLRRICWQLCCHGKLPACWQLFPCWQLSCQQELPTSCQRGMPQWGSCKKVARKLSESASSCQKVVGKFSESYQKVVRNFWPKSDHYPTTFDPTNPQNQLRKSAPNWSENTRSQ